MNNDNLKIPQNLEEMLKLVNSNNDGYSRYFGWYYNKKQGWIIPYFTDCSGHVVIIDKASIQKLISGLQEFCRKVNQYEIDAFNLQQLQELTIREKGDINYTKGVHNYLTQPIELSVTPEKPGFIYLIAVEEKYKIGRAVDINKRLQSLQTGSHLKLEVAHIIPTNNPKLLEKELHNKYKQYRISGEWFKLPQQIVDEIKEM